VVEYKYSNRPASANTSLTGIPYGADGAGVPVQRFRDMLKSVTAMEDEDKVYLLLAIEAQSEVHHAMPVRNMVYDALQYAAQVEEAARSHRAARLAGNPEELAKKPDNSEYLSGFYREERLIPVITLVMYFAPGEWDGPMSLHEMVQKDDRFRNMDRQAATVISTVTGVEIIEKEEEEKVDMCQALKEMMEDAVNEANTATARRMLQEGSSSMEFIAQMTGLSLEEVSALAKTYTN